MEGTTPTETHRENTPMNTTETATETATVTALEKLLAHLGAESGTETELGYSHYGLTIYEIAGAEYAVGTDAECDDAWNESLDSYIAECITPELEKLDGLGSLASYVKFDEEMWKRDAKMDGRGHSLSSYDGDEIELGGDFYAYRTN